jgi:hypothetical protein
MTQELDRPAIEFLLPADRAEAIGGKLYMLGGGWDRIAVSDFSQPVPLGIAIGLLIPRSRLGQELSLHIFVKDAAENVVNPAVRVHVSIPPGSAGTEGLPNRAMLAVNGVWIFPRPGIYRIEGQLSDTQPRSFLFLVEAVR